MERLPWKRAIICGALVTAAFGSGRLSSAVPPPGFRVTQDGARTFTDAQGQLVPSPAISIVGIESFFPAGATSARLGSGFVVAVDGEAAWIVTAGHVVTDGAAAVYLPGDRVPHLADAIAPDAGADLALLHVPRLPGVAPVRLSGVPSSAWAAEV